MRLPEIKKDLHDFEKAAQISVDVLVNLKNWKGIMIGRYIHSIGEWQVNGVCGTIKDDVVEWWDLPEMGTGYKIDD